MCGTQLSVLLAAASFFLSFGVLTVQNDCVDVVRPQFSLWLFYVHTVKSGLPWTRKFKLTL
jgi:hypothetical protein